ncbi:CDP-alcohol phosphatidyltransferase family protein [Patescibacteria group bacterium]
MIGWRNCWFICNLPNMITCSRLFIPVILFFPGMLFWTSDWDFESQFFWALVLSFTDAIDGELARRIGNSDGIGKHLDPVMDRVTVVALLVFFYVNQLIDPAFLLIILAIEIMTMIMFYFFNGRVNEFGKAKMIFYFAGILLVYVNLISGLGFFAEEIIQTVFLSGIITAMLALMCYVVGDVELIEMSDEETANHYGFPIC